MSAAQTNYGVPGVGTFSVSTPQTLLAETIGENRAGRARATVIARRVSDGAAKAFEIEFGFKRDTGNLDVFGVNVLNALGTAADLIALASVSATVDASGDDLRVRVTGLASTEIDWSAVVLGVSVDHE